MRGVKLMNRNMNNACGNCRNNCRQCLQQAALFYCVLVTVLMMTLASWSASVPAQESTPAANSYAQNCALCHGDDGAGAMPGVPELTLNMDWARMTDSVLVKRIQQGIKTPASQMGMPPNAGNPNLSEQDLRLAIEHLRQLLAAGK